MENAKHSRKKPFRTQDRPELSRPLPPDPDELNACRAQWAAVALAAFRRQTGADAEDALSDLLADLMHWCDRSGLSFVDELRRALGHYEEEAPADSETSARLTQLL